MYISEVSDVTAENSEELGNFTEIEMMDTADQIEDDPLIDGHTTELLEKASMVTPALSKVPLVLRFDEITEDAYIGFVTPWRRIGILVGSILCFAMNVMDILLLLLDGQSWMSHIFYEDCGSVRPRLVLLLLLMALCTIVWNSAQAIIRRHTIHTCLLLSACIIFCALAYPCWINTVGEIMVCQAKQGHEDSQYLYGGGIIFVCMFLPIAVQILLFMPFWISALASLMLFLSFLFHSSYMTTE